MSEQASGHGHAAPNPFTPTEVALFQSEDRNAATAMIGLMVGIFMIGIAIYTVVCISVS